MPDAAGLVHVAGVLVRVTDPAVRLTLARVPGVEIHTADPSGRSLVITIDAASAAHLRATHDAIGQVPGVTAADLVVHIADAGDRGQAQAGGS